MRRLSAVLTLAALSLGACASEPSDPMPEATAAQTETAPQPRAEMPRPDAPAAQTDREALLDIARAKIGESGLGGEVEFSDPWVRQSGDWAFVRSAFARPGGQALSETDPAYCENDAVVELLLRRSGDGWEVVSGDPAGPYCVSDFAGYDRYVTEYGAPRDLFPAS